ncbi:hypothetical protein J2Z60_000541 [Lactobacillus colini]|uniref:Uncharacterized protein n=1 Tax=Lactobacillus colini TaxID=1819254 RepID=A0ABS4MDC1_9LACO|nr:hypothetical protein [Lactobacillus colini]MBP2057377.1 hypothetical protein [Lactobacillus colini]
MRKAAIIIFLILSSVLALGWFIKPSSIIFSGLLATAVLVFIIADISDIIEVGLIIVNFFKSKSKKKM